MAPRKKNTAQQNGPHSAPHTPPRLPPAPAAGPPADSPAAAVWAALTASPGATAAQIATAAGTSRIVAGRELAALEASGRVTRTPGARTGRATAPATWQAAPQPPPQAPDAPAGADEAPPASLAADTATASPAPAARDGDLPTPSGEPDEAAGGAPDAGTAGSAPEGDGTAGETAPAPADSHTPGEADEGGAADDGTAADGAGETCTPASAGGEPQPAAAEEAAALLRELASAAIGAGEALDGGNTAAALAVMDAICADAAQSRRLVKAAASGRKPRGTGTSARPGQLRDLVDAHLLAHPSVDFTPHQIGRVLNRSSGAVANALDRLTALGQAQLTSEKPRRYRHQTPAGTPASAPAPATT